MNNPNFSSILDAPATDAVRPPALPAGHYVAMVKGLPRKDKSTKKGTEFIEYTISIVSVWVDEEGASDVDEEALAEFGDIAGKEMKFTFYFTEKSAYRHREFLEDDLGIDLTDKSHWEGAQEAAGSQFVVNIRQKPSDDGKGVFSEIAGTAPLKE